MLKLFAPVGFPRRFVLFLLRFCDCPLLDPLGRAQRQADMSAVLLRVADDARGRGRNPAAGGDQGREFFLFLTPPSPPEPALQRGPLAPDPKKAPDTCHGHPTTPCIRTRGP